jgi:hypothetical protein
MARRRQFGQCVVGYDVAASLRITGAMMSGVRYIGT